MAAGTAAALIGGAVIGGIAGSMGKEQRSTSTNTVDLAPDTELGRTASAGALSDYRSLQELVNAGAPAGRAAQAGSVEASKGLTEMLAAYAKGGFLPSEADLGTSSQFARDIFAAQQTALDQGFEDEQTRMQRLAAQLGRPVNDPILQAKYAQEKLRQQQTLEAQKTGFVAQEARNLPLQRLAFQGQLADVQSQLASQALQNRMALLNVGSQLQANERDFRLGTATRRGEQNTYQPGGLQGALTGAVGGMALGSQIGGLFGGGSGVSTGSVVGPQAGSGFAAGSRGAAGFNPWGGNAGGFMLAGGK